MGGTGVGAPSAATQESMPELAIAHEHFQYYVRAVANEALKGDSAGAAAGETIAVCNVTEVGKLASAVADGAGGSFVRDGGHGWFLRGASLPCEEQYSMAGPLSRPVTNLHKGSQCERAGAGPCGEQFPLRTAGYWF